MFLLYKYKTRFFGFPLSCFPTLIIYLSVILFDCLSPALLDSSLNSIAEMFGSKKSPLNISKHNKVGPEFHASSRPNPFGSNDELDIKKTVKPQSRKPSSEPNLTTLNFSTNPLDNEQEIGASSSSTYSLTSAKHMYKNDFRDSRELENQSVQELENYAVFKA